MIQQTILIKIMQYYTQVIIVLAQHHYHQSRENQLQVAKVKNLIGNNMQRMERKHSKIQKQNKHEKMQY